MNALPKLFFTDIDGVWTDGGMYYSSSGEEMKKFNTSDSAGVSFLRLLGIETVIITGESTRMVADRATKLGITEVHQGVLNKLECASMVCARFGVELSECAHIGDDLNDLVLLRNVGYAACPRQAPEYIKREVHYVTEKHGGEGAFREAVENLLTSLDVFDHAMSLFLKRHA
ncbi:MAG: KdsC family phosphatase [Flavobacteriales bacterium]|jgi:3-deoxy-D-manno-octulosonate 8-phosphate phosphatase (KDO 8-P phosphatase)